MKILTVVIVFLLLVVNPSFSQEKTKQFDYGKLIFMSPTYDMIADIGDDKFVVPIVTQKKRALLDCFNYELDKIYSTPFKNSTKSTKDNIPLVPAFHNESKTLYAIRHNHVNRKFFMEYLQIDPDTGKTINQIILFDNQPFPYACYFSDNKEYFAIVPLFSLDGIYTYELYNYEGEKLYTNTIRNKDSQSISSALNLMTVSDEGDVYINRRIKINNYSIDAYSVTGQNIGSLELKVESKKDDVIDIIMTESNDKVVLITALTGSKKSFELVNWVADYNDQELRQVGSFHIDENSINDYIKKLDESQILSVKKPTATKELEKLRIVDTHYADGQIIVVLEAYDYIRWGMPGAIGTAGISNDTYIISTKVTGELNWVFAIPRKVTQNISKYKQFGPMGETVKAKTDIIDGVLKVITTENYSNGEYGFDVLRDIDLKTGEVSSPIRLQSKKNPVYDFSFYNYFKWLNNDELIMMTSKGFGFKLVKIYLSEK